MERRRTLRRCGSTSFAARAAAFRRRRKRPRGFRGTEERVGNVLLVYGSVHHRVNGSGSRFESTLRYRSECSAGRPA